MACEKDHATSVPRQIESLQESQKGFWRHRCAGCAYEMGRRDAEAADERLRERVRALTAERDALTREIDELRTKNAVKK